MNYQSQEEFNHFECGEETMFGEVGGEFNVYVGAYEIAKYLGIKADYQRLCAFLHLLGVKKVKNEKNIDSYILNKKQADLVGQTLKDLRYLLKKYYTK